VLDLMKRLYTRDQYLERIAWIKSARREISLTTDIIVGFPGETEADFEQTIDLMHEVGYDSAFTFKYSPRPNTPALEYPDSIPEEEKTLRLSILQERQKQVQISLYKRHIGQTLEVMVEGRNDSRSQWIGRTAQHKTLNFTADAQHQLKNGDYVPVRVTGTFPNSLVGELAV
jgi:tRNA-2-methylthio-N6-dimethylallyladenosine synthase